MLLKFILFLVLAYTLLRVVRWLGNPSPSGGRRVADRSPRAAHMIRCATCGLFVTQKSALVLGGREFCSKSCAEQRVHST
jgi:hypothetical protein